MIAMDKRFSRSLVPAVILLLAVVQQTAWSQANAIANIRVEGARFVSPDGVLAKVNEVLQVGNAFDPNSAGDQAKLEAARQAVLGLGYFERVTAAVQEEADGVTLTFVVVEKTRIQRIVFVGNTVFTDDELLEVIISRPGQIIDARTLSRDLDLIKSHYIDNGRGVAVNAPVVDRFGVVTFVVNEWIIEAVQIEGLKRTKESTVRRVIEVEPGDVFDSEALGQDARAINNLGLWTDVQMEYRPGIKDESGVIVVFVVEEKRTGTATGGFGYSSLDDFVGLIEVAETNFRGKGERISARIQFGGRQSYELGFMEPALWGGDTTLEVRVFDTERRRQFLTGGSFSTTEREFDERRKGFNVTVGHRLNRQLSASLRLRREEIEDPYFYVTRIIAPSTGAQLGTLANIPGLGNDDIPPGPSNPNLDPDEPEPGETVFPLPVSAPLADENLSSITAGLILDTRDLHADPTKGGFSSFYLEQAGIVGGDSDFTKLTIDTRRYIKVPKRDHVVAIRFLGGATFGDVPLVESYSVGGAYTLRGYREDRFRGDNMAVLSTEYRWPMTKNITAVGFVDIGDAWGGTFATGTPGFNIPSEHDSFEPSIGYGIGARLGTPFGRLRLDLGRGSEGSEVHLSFGHTF